MPDLPVFCNCYFGELIFVICAAWTLCWLRMLRSLASLLDTAHLAPLKSVCMSFLKDACVRYCMFVSEMLKCEVTTGFMHRSVDVQMSLARLTSTDFHATTTRSHLEDV